MECTRWHKNQQGYLEVIWKENKTDDVICLHFGVYGNICGHMIPSSDCIPVSFAIFSSQSYLILADEYEHIVTFIPWWILNKFFTISFVRPAMSKLKLRFQR